ncbi:MAG: polysaccharide biosynthesis/export family protein [Candidatus Rokubacteria bacterium]|nr:polysaccharide biosynthesis/export family protein [Candidatus Rokubacteria bacterium]
MTTPRSIVMSLALVAVTSTVAVAQTKPVNPPAAVSGAPARSVPAASAATGTTATIAPAAAPTGPATAPRGLAPAVPTDYVIGPDDVLFVTVWKNDTLSKQVPVRPDGKISLPLLHDIQAAGLTAMQLQDKIAVALGEFMPNPEVSVMITDVRSYRVSVLGEVNRPGVLQLKAETSILEALAMAGGFRDFASPSKIMVFRKDSYGNTHKLRFNYNKALRGDEDNLALKTGDVIVVP